MRDRTHQEHLEQWAEYVKNNPDWKKHHTEFINAQFDKAYQFIERIKKQKGGKEKIVQLYGIKNKKGYKNLLS